ncbi:MAG: carboxypeptidase-like regulatory domain-containing protein [Planctomycetaceae bacterium]|jgi:hypothetical protein|nr:carboxypeptidase-like regulatory domain-containing protein [Planctomycetaceae bacterium]
MKQILFLFSFIFILTTVGCGSSVLKTEIVVGKVTFNGVPLIQANVKFFPVSSGEEAQPSYAITDDAGEYRLQTLYGAPNAGTTPGDYVVTITKAEMVSTGRKMRDSEGVISEERKPKLVIPKNYTEIEKTPFKVTVVAHKKNIFDFELKDNESK